MRSLFVGVVFLLAILANASQSSVPQEPVPPATKTVVRTFQQGVHDYQGTIDTEMWELAPNQVLEKNDSVTSDADNDGGESQILLRFEKIIGKDPGQIPPHASIHSARLIITAFDPGNTVNLHRMLVPWDRSATWNTMISGITADGLEASRHKDSFTFGKISANKTVVIFECTDTVQSWVSGKANFGWAFLNTGGNGWDFYSSEFEEVESRPLLRIEFTPPE